MGIVYKMLINFISTHTLTWSVTADQREEAKTDIDFNSHAHVERDQMILKCQCVF